MKRRMRRSFRPCAFAFRNDAASREDLVGPLAAMVALVLALVGRRNG